MLSVQMGTSKKGQPFQVSDDKRDTDVMWIGSECDASPGVGATHE